MRSAARATAAATSELAAGRRGAAEADGARRARRARGRGRVGAPRARRVFGELADPRKETARLDDGVPDPAAAAAARDALQRSASELWVRVFPDDVRGRHLRARLVRERGRERRALLGRGLARRAATRTAERAAWRGLVASHGTGRAGWIVEQLRAAEPAGRAGPRSSRRRRRPRRRRPDRPLPRTAAAPRRLLGGGVARRRRRAAASRPHADALDGRRRAAAAAAAAVARHAAVNLDRSAAPRTHARDGAADGRVPATCRAGDSTGCDLVVARRRRRACCPTASCCSATTASALALEQLGEPIPRRSSSGPTRRRADDALRRRRTASSSSPTSCVWLFDFDRAVAGRHGLPGRARRPHAARASTGSLVLGLRIARPPTRRASRARGLLAGTTAQPRPGSAWCRRERRPTTPRRRGVRLRPRATTPTPRFDDPSAGAELGRRGRLRSSGATGSGWPTALGHRPDALVAHAAAPRHATSSRPRAMNTALWPATLGYMLETMMQPARRRARPSSGARASSPHYVSGRGPCPRCAIGAPAVRDPAGDRVLAARAGRGEDGQRTPASAAAVQARLDALLRQVAADWAPLAARGARTSAPAAIRTRRCSTWSACTRPRSSSTSATPRASTTCSTAPISAAAGRVPTARVRAAAPRSAELASSCRGLGYDGRRRPRSSTSFFARGQQRAERSAGRRPAAVGEPTRCARTRPTAATTSRGWPTPARASLDDLRAQEGFVDDGPPTALLYLLLRHALLLSWWDTALRLRVDGGQHRATTCVAARGASRAFVHVDRRPRGGEREPLAPCSTTADVSVTGDPACSLADFIPTIIGPGLAARARATSSSRRSRRWPTCRPPGSSGCSPSTSTAALPARRLAARPRAPSSSLAMRGGSDGAAPPPAASTSARSAGSRTCARRSAALTPVELAGRALADALRRRRRTPPLMRDAANGGYLHAPSLNHAVHGGGAAQRLLADATRGDPGALAVNLTSERVRLALGVIEGIRNGQTLGALLGYRFERGAARPPRPRRGRRVRLTRCASGSRCAPTGSATPRPTPTSRSRRSRRATSSTASSSSSHVDEHRRHCVPVRAHRPAGRARPRRRAAIDAEVAAPARRARRHRRPRARRGRAPGGPGQPRPRRRDAGRVRTGGFPPEPAVVETPRTGVTLTHRVALHLRTGLSHTASPVAGVPMTPRAIAEPAVNELARGDAAAAGGRRLRRELDRPGQRRAALHDGHPGRPRACSPST